MTARPLPYPKSVICGFCAAGRDGKASALILPLPPLRLAPGAVEAGREVGAEFGLEDGADDAECTHGMVVTLPVWVCELLDAGSSGNANLLEFVVAVDAVPQDRVCETEEREDCAVELLSFRTRVDFGPEAFVADEEAEVVSQPRGRVPEVTDEAGREG